VALNDLDGDDVDEDFLLDLGWRMLGGSKRRIEVRMRVAYLVERHEGHEDFFAGV